MYTQDSLPRRLRLVYPDMSAKEALAHHVNICGSYREAAKRFGPGVSIATISRWMKKWDLCSPQVSQGKMQVVRKLIKEGGDNLPLKEVLENLFKKEGTWKKVAVRLNVTVPELYRYRVALRMVPKSKWLKRVDMARRMETHEILYSW